MTAQQTRVGTDLHPDLGTLLTDTLGRGLRTPLHSLMGFLELLAMSDVDGDQRRLVDHLVACSEELLSASDRLVWLVRLVSGTHAPRPEAVDVADVVRDVVALTGRPTPVHVVPGATTAVTVDIPALLQLLAELVTNAHRHGHAPVSVVVAPGAGGAAAGTVRLTVADAGTGLGAAEVERLTGPAGLPQAGGSLGLLLARRLGEHLGAGLEVAARDTGTRISLDLPVMASQPAAGPGRPAGPPDAGGARSPSSTPEDEDLPLRPLTVLLVEDNATNRLLASRQLDRLGHDLVAATTGRAGVETALAGGVDVVLMDLHLPDIEGSDAARLIRTAESGRGTASRLPIIAVTADTTPRAREVCRAAGIDEVLTKPVDLEDLAAALTRAARTRGQRAAPASTAPDVPAVLRRVADRVDGDPVAVALFVATYLAELPARRLRIQASLRRAEHRAVVAAAESLRTASETMGASALAGACAALGAAVHSRSIDAARAFLPALLQHSEELQEELAPYTDHLRVAAALRTGARGSAPLSSAPRGGGHR